MSVDMRGARHSADRRQKVLNVGSGPSASNRLHPAFRGPDWREVRLDIDPRVRPDIVGSAEDLTAIGDGAFDAVWSSHNLEHLHTHQVPGALRELVRVLRPEGFALITCPDMAAIAELVGRGELERPAYVSPAGPITPLDMIFGHSRSIAEGNAYMAHRTAFTAERLDRLLREAGFEDVRLARGRAYDLWAVALMSRGTAAAVRRLLGQTEQRHLLGDDPAGIQRPVGERRRIPKVARIG